MEKPAENPREESILRDKSRMSNLLMKIGDVWKSSAGLACLASQNMLLQNNLVQIDSYSPYDYEGAALRGIRNLLEKRRNMKYKKTRKVDARALRLSLDFERPKANDDMDSNINLQYSDDEKEVKLNFKKPEIYFGLSAKDKFWTLYKNSRTFKDVQENIDYEDPRFAYLKTCKEFNILPKASHIIGLQPSRDFNYSNKGLGHKSCKAVADSIKKFQIPMERVNFCNNQIRSIESNLLLSALTAHFSSITNLNFSNNRMGISGTKELGSKLKLMKCLKILNIESIMSGDEGAFYIFEGVKEINVNEIYMGKNGIGRSRQAVDMIDAFETYINLTRSLEVLDLCWNNLGGNIGKKFLLSLSYNRSLLKLDISYNVFGSGTGIMKGEAAINEIIEVLILNKTIEEIDVGFNGIDCSSIFCIAYGIECTSSLKIININGNPIGSRGIQYLVNAIRKNKRQKFEKFIADDVGMSILSIPNSQIPNFDSTNLQKDYLLDLSLAFSRCILRKLLDLDLQLSVITDGLSKEGECFTKLKLDGKQFSLPQQDAYGNWECDFQKGKLGFTFSLKHMSKIDCGLTMNEVIQYAMESKTSGSTDKVLSESNFSKHLNALIECRIRGDNENQEDIALNMAYEYKIWSSQAIEILNTFPDGPNKEQVAACLFPKIQDRHLRMSLFGLFPHASCRSIWKQMKRTFQFHPDNPTGHYVLDLAKPSERCILDELLVINRKGEKLLTELEYTDNSMHGNKSCFRAEQFNFQPFVYNKEWLVPKTGVFEFDFVYLFPPSGECECLREEEFSLVVSHVESIELDFHTKARIFRILCESIWLSNSQLRRIIELHQEPSWRKSVFMSGVGKLVDNREYDMIKTCVDSNEMMAELYTQIGILNLFNPYHSNGLYKFNVKVHEELIVLAIIAELARKEGVDGVKELTIDGKRIRDDEIPPIVKMFPKEPKEGIIEMTYFCPIEKEDNEFREELGKKYLNWR